MAFFNISRAPLVSRNSRFNLAISFSSSLAQFPEPGEGTGSSFIFAVWI